jgi:hypothetical protein
MVSKTLGLLAGLGIIVLVVLALIGCGLGTGLAVFFEIILEFLPLPKKKKTS